MPYKASALGPVPPFRQRTKQRSSCAEPAQSKHAEGETRRYSAQPIDGSTAVVTFSRSNVGIRVRTARSYLRAEAKNATVERLERDR